MWKKERCERRVKDRWCWLALQRCVPRVSSPRWPAKNLQGWICLKAHVCLNLYGVPQLSMLIWPSGGVILHSMIAHHLCYFSNHGHSHYMHILPQFLKKLFEQQGGEGLPTENQKHEIWKSGSPQKSCFSSDKMSQSSTSYLVLKWYWDILLNKLNCEGRWCSRIAGATRNVRQRLVHQVWSGMIWYDLIW